MSFKPFSGRWKSIWLPVTPSTVLAAQSIVTFTTGKLVASTAGTAAVANVGIAVGVIAAADSDYADDRLIEVLVPTEKHATVKATTASLVATDVGGEFDLTDASTVNRAASSVDAVKCMKYLSGTEGVFMVKFNGSY